MHRFHRKRREIFPCAFCLPVKIKQNERFYKNKCQDIPLVVIALEEGSTPDAVRDSVNKAKKQIKKNLKNL